MNRYLISALIGLFFIKITFGQEAAVVKISKSRIARDVFVLASDSLEGRKFGQSGHQKAINYISKEFQHAGLKSLNDADGFVQQIPVKSVVTGTTILSAQNSKYLNKESISFASIQSVSDSLSLPIKFIGWRESFPQRVGKDTALHIFARSAQDGARRIENLSKATGGQFYVLTLGKRERLNREMVMLEAKAANENYPSGVFNMGTANKKWLRDCLPQSNPSLKVLLIMQSQLRSIYGNDLGEYLEEVVQSGKMDKEFTFTPMVKVDLNISYRGFDSISFDKNVYAYLEGTDLKDEYILLCAHFDHLGKNEESIYYGADDNASGVAVILELARSLAEAKQNGLELRRSVVFLAFGAEETGLNGSHYYVNNPLFPLQKTVMLLNFDMVGRPNWSLIPNNHVYVLPFKKRGLPFKRDLNEIGNQMQGFEFRWDADFKDRIMYRFGSDHHPFVKKGIPSVAFTTRSHADYHKTTDTPDKIDYNNIEKLVKAMVVFVIDAANNPKSYPLKKR